MELIRVQDSDYRKTYELYMTFPENENGYMNNVYGYNYEQFLEWIEKKRNWSLGKELPEGSPCLRQPIRKIRQPATGS